MVPQSPDGIGLSRLYKPVTVGMTLGNTDAVSYAGAGRVWKPYSPVHVEASRDGGGDITVRWVRRTRTGGGWRDGVDVPLGETAERYEAEVMDGSEVVRVMQATSPEMVYSAAMQVADFGALQGAVTVRVYQMSEVVGRGYPAEAVV